eukprot:CAMPEP_0169275168 /NCGR_PEP_ID=MMETSP1016-20121227/52182_1 /TAXON_ID=342587 /ORGANISM="Karlodinium micrum, Strain CCMP2283" /LENGTH=35 /DNA_ID= /DNA_START= /DNA_END= /DNA_ORIENTATION=
MKSQVPINQPQRASDVQATSNAFHPTIRESNLTLS